MDVLFRPVYGVKAEYRSFTDFEAAKEWTLAIIEAHR